MSGAQKPSHQNVSGRHDSAADHNNEEYSKNPLLWDKTSISDEVVLLLRRPKLEWNPGTNKYMCFYPMAMRSCVYHTYLHICYSGILPLEIETGRYSGVPPEKRYCRVCNLPVVEDEYHFLYSCPLLQAERSKFYVDHISDFETFILLDDASKTRLLLGEDMIKHMGEWLEIMYFKRRSIVYKVTE